MTRKSLADWLQEESEKEWKTEMEKHQMNDEATLKAILGRDSIPDFLKMKKEGLQPVFVYGTLKQGHWNHYLLEESDYLGEAESVVPNFDITLSSPGGGFPIAWRFKEPNDFTGHIRGEVYACDARVMANLDSLEGNGYMYQRQQVHFWLRDQTIEGKSGPVSPSLKCWIYIGVKDYWKDVPQNNNVPLKKINMTNGTSKWVISYEKHMARAA